jgi:hypothetical protein
VLGVLSFKKQRRLSMPLPRPMAALPPHANVPLLVAPSFLEVLAPAQRLLPG